MNIQIEVENIKCGGCASSVTSKLTALDSVNEVSVDIENGMVHIDGEENRRNDYVDTLAKIGYPEVGSVEGLASTGAKVKSFVSCAIGRTKDS